MLVMNAWNLWRRFRNKLCNISRRNKLNLLAVVIIIMLLLIVQYRIKHNRKCGRKIANMTTEIMEEQASIELPSWVCRNEKCEQVSAINVSKVQSLETCNMLCSSTQLWPQPTGNVMLREPAVPVRADRFRLEIVSSPSGPVSQHLRAAFSLMLEELRRLEREGWHAPARGGAERGARGVLVAVSVSGSGDPRLTLATDESYTLTVSEGDSGGSEVRAAVSARSFCGARHAFETLSQLIWWDPYVGSLHTLATVSVADSPRFHYRGLLLDTARNFYPLADLLRTVDAMGAVKLNTFHWHVSDSQAFPLRLRAAPQLARHGAYGAREQYSPADVRALVRRARLRGVRVLVEVDAPAHVGAAWSWGPRAGLGPLAVACPEGKPFEGHLNPLNPHVYTLLGKIYAEIIELTGVDDIFHLGGDEVSLECWERLTKQHTLQDAMELWENFTRRAMFELKRANGGKALNVTLLWSSPLTEEPHLARLGEGLTVQVWHDDDTFKLMVRAGRRSVVSLVDWYLDCGFGSWRNEEAGHCQYRSWQQMYNARPWGAGRDPGVVGGEACAWSEQLDAGGLDARVWPRAAAVAERLWSDEEDDATPDVYLRLDTMRARLLARGVRAAPLWPRWCTLNPHLCPT